MTANVPPAAGPDLWVEAFDPPVPAEGTAIATAAEPPQPGGAAGPWSIAWRVTNRSREGCTVEMLALPHARVYAADARVPDVLGAIAAGGSLEIDTPAVLVDGEPGEVIRSPFVILRVLWQATPWRVFARLRVEIDAEGVPHPITEAVSTQRVGFSEPGR